jgi:hypothetical protein
MLGFQVFEGACAKSEDVHHAIINDAASSVTILLVIVLVVFY